MRSNSLLDAHAFRIKFVNAVFARSKKYPIAMLYVDIAVYVHCNHVSQSGIMHMNESVRAKMFRNANNA